MTISKEQIEKWKVESGVYKAPIYHSELQAFAELAYAAGAEAMKKNCITNLKDEGVYVFSGSCSTAKDAVQYCIAVIETTS